ncbi:MAG: arginine deiminase-related protein [Patescibacteria group bacterium]
MQTASINPKKALKQWENLVQVYKDLGITVEIINQVKGLPDMVFSTDQSLIFGNNVLLSRFRYKERQGETPFYAEWYKNHGFEIVQLPQELYFEGNGTMHFWNDKLFVAIGYRTDVPVCRYLQKLFPDIEVVQLHTRAPAFYHFDIGFFPLDDQTIFFSPDAYIPESQKLLKNIVPNFIPLTRKETEGFSANSIVTGKTVVRQKGNPTFGNKLAALGYESIEVDLSEFKKSGGGINCLTNILEMRE